MLDGRKKNKAIEEEEIKPSQKKRARTNSNKMHVEENNPSPRPKIGKKKEIT